MRKFAFSRHSLALFGLLLLTACTKTPVEVSSLGMKLSAPQLKSTSPFDQDMDTQGYVEFSGECSAFVSKLSISLDNQTFYDIPAQSTYTPLNGTSTTHDNDTDCADGQFSFYLTDPILTTWLGHAPAHDEIQTIFIRGDGLMGQTESLAIVNDRGSDGGGPATALKIEKVYPSGQIGQGKCGTFNVSARTANDNPTSVSTAVNFTVTEVPSGPVTLYTDLNDCENSVTAGTTLTLAANNSNRQVFIRAPSTGTVVTYSLGTNAVLTTNSVTVNMFDSTASSTQKWVGIDGGYWKIYKNICYPAKVVAHNYDSFGSLWSTHTPAVNVTLTTTDSKLQFFTTNTCTTSSSTATISPYVASQDVWFKYVDTVTTTGSKRLSVSTSGSASGFTLTGDTLFLDVDLDSAKANPTIVTINGPNNVGSGVCQLYQIRLMNQNWASVPNNTGAAIAVQLSSSLSASAGKFFPTSTACSSGTGEATTFSIASGDMSTDVYFRGAVSSTTVVSLTAAASTLTTNTQSVRISPVPYQLNASFTNITSAYKFIAGGFVNMCVIDQADHLSCSGDNSYHQLLDGTTTTSLTLKLMDSGQTYKAVTVGDGFICGLTLAGVVRCWGKNASGQIGNSTVSTEVTTPYVVDTDYTEISAGQRHVCGVTTAQQIRCWGENSYGQLGNGTTTSSTAPMVVTGGYSFASVSAGYTHTCGILSSGGGLKCWGSSTYGSLGDGSSTGYSVTPVGVSGLSGVNFVSAGAAYTCAVTNSNGLYCWGYNSNGQLGDGSTTNRLTPTAVSGTFTGISTGDGHTCAISTNSKTACWGMNANGVLGIGDNADRASPTYINNSNYVSLGAGSYSRCGLTNSGQLFCWGTNNYGTIPNDLPLYSQHYAPEDMSCYAVTLNLYDYMGMSIVTPSAIAGQVNTTNSNSGNLYGNISCTGNGGTAVQNLAVSIPASSSQTTLYTRHNSDAYVNLTLSGFGSLIKYGITF